MNSIDLTKIKRYSVKDRKSKVKREDFAKACKKGGNFREFYDYLPKILAGETFKKVVEAIVNARIRKKPVIFMLGAHVIKCGLNPLIIDLIKRDVITLIASNGAGMIHDFEVAFAGFTSEDVEEAIEDGSFGMAKETADFINEAIKEGIARKEGIGLAVGRMIKDKRLPYRLLSILYTCFQKRIPATIHVAIGTDIIHQHPSCSGSAMGQGSLKDFHALIQQVAELGDGGAVVNIGSAVILPEVFLKAVTVARNLGFKVKNFTAANFDKLPHYRPDQNVVRRPVAGGGRGYYIIGHHEIMIPLLHRSIIERI